MSTPERSAAATLAGIPAALRPPVEARWRALAAELDAAARTDGAAAALAALPRVFACSEFVAQAAERDPALVRELLESPSLLRPYAAGELASEVRRAAATAVDEAGLKAALRRLRRREMVRLAWRDIAGEATLDEVLATLSELADASIDAALAWLTARFEAEYGSPRSTRGEPVRLVVLALGKLGGGELNFSSDVDLVFAFAEEGELAGPRGLSHSEFFLRLCQALIRVLAEPTADGFVFRVDTRLRPFGASGPLALSFDAMEHYYQVHGREWERYALIKARACAGDRAAGEELLAQLRPFVYRRYIDFGALAAIREMKELIAREVERRSMAGNIKLGPGGIREIEFVAQALQLIRGGREPALQQRATLAALGALARAGHLEPRALEELRAAYEFLRRSEHCLQMVADQQVHDLPREPLEQARLAYAMGYADWASYSEALEHHRRIVHAHFNDLLGAERRGGEARDDYAALWSEALDQERAAAVLRAAGYRDPAAVLALLGELRSSTMYEALSSEGRARLDRLLPLLLRETARAATPDVTIARLVRLCEAIGRRTAYFALLIENPHALTQLVGLAAASPWIADWISRYPVLLDELLDPRGLYQLPERAALEAELAGRLASLAGSLEAQMDALREFKNAYLLRVAAADIGPGLPPDRVGVHLAQLADVLLAASLDLSWQMLVERHGPPGGDARCPDPGFAVIGYGKLGSLELGYASDLDMIFLYDDAEGATTQGPRPIPNELYFARLGQRLIHLLTTRTAAGSLYEVDMRLRPSGNAGPLVTSLSAFARYQREQAWTWEHQALVRARAVAGKPALRAAFEATRLAVLCQPREEAKLRADVAAMRTRMAAARGVAADGFDVKHDRGGIVDIEFMVQYWVLRWAHAHPEIARPTDNIHILEALAGSGLIPADWAQTLADAYRRCLAVEQRIKLMEQGTRVAPAALGDVPQAVISIWNQVFEE
ncbi:MAG TPA: bifunctional [glutamate--ammonia ligase]-adenylyl-L-tyrosine phosphorylase/[glutamate--ammonia-ligase] adenylyltransferase [Burkholderiales bacterium]